MKLKTPDGFENAEMRSKLSPIIGQPMLPGMFVEVLDDAHERRHMKTERMSTRARSTSICNSISSIALQARYNFQVTHEVFISYSEESCFCEHIHFCSFVLEASKDSLGCSIIPP